MQQKNGKDLKVLYLFPILCYTPYKEGVILMIYSDDINKICAVCVHAVKIAGDDSHMRCTRKRADKSVSDTCAKFRYDILKKPTRRRRRLNTDFKPEDFTL